jgi:hypothetical protein
MLEKLEADMNSNGYNSKQRNTWIVEALTSLLCRKDCPALIAEEFMIAGSSKQIPLKVEKTVNILMDDTLIKTQDEMGIEKDRSAVIRTAITQRILASNGRQISEESIESITSKKGKEGLK